ncbi:hypothetical protein CDIMF43_110189 [Carnobacterium divergens]|nr:hypothetical protein CDIMF43_110189 [Carnobacterium divergens]
MVIKAKIIIVRFALYLKIGPVKKGSLINFKELFILSDDGTFINKNSIINNTNVFKIAAIKIKLETVNFIPANIISKGYLKLKK